MHDGRIELEKNLVRVKRIGRWFEGNFGGFETGDWNPDGNELEIFELAENWKNYLASRMKPYIAGRVLEVGAGLGANTRILCGEDANFYLALEPDSQLCPEPASELCGMHWSQPSVTQGRPPCPMRQAAAMPGSSGSNSTFLTWSLRHRHLVMETSHCCMNSWSDRFPDLGRKTIESLNGTF